MSNGDDLEPGVTFAYGRFWRNEGFEGKIDLSPKPDDLKQIALRMAERHEKAERLYRESLEQDDGDHT